MLLTYLVQIILLIQGSCWQKLSRIQPHLGKKDAFFLVGVFSLLFFHIFKVQSQMLFFRTYLPTQRQQGELFGNSRKKSIHCFLWGLRLPSHNQTSRVRYDAGQSTEPWEACNGNRNCEHMGRTPITVNAGEAAALRSDCPSAMPLSFLREQWEN